MIVRKYISVKYDDKTQWALRKWCIGNGFDLTKSYSGSDIDYTSFIFHTTIFYSANPVFLMNQEIHTGKLVSQVTGFKLLGEAENVPVLTVDSPDLRSIRKYYELLGLKDNWPEWIPHVSVSYADTLPEDLSDLVLPDFDLYFDVLSIEDIDEEV